MGSVRATALLALVGLFAVSMSQSATAAPGQPNAQDQALAKTSVLRLSDMPTGWVSTAASSTAQADQVRRGILECRRYQTTVVALRKQPRAATNFDQQNNSISSDVAVTPSVRAAQAAYAGLTYGGVSSCFQKAFGQIITQSLSSRGASAKLQTISGGEQSEPAVGAQSAAYEFTATFSALGLTPQVYITQDVFRVGRSLAALDSEYTASPVPDDLRQSMISTVAGRLGRTSASAPATTTTLPLTYPSGAAVPPGYPKLVPLSSIDSRVENWFTINPPPSQQAVEVAPGVFAPDNPAAPNLNSYLTGPVNGDCAVIMQDFPRAGSTCWDGVAAA
jgi:hypothetical protein